MQVNPIEPPNRDLTGKTVGRFGIRARLGEGGMGEVYLAEDLALKRQVALKRIPWARRADERARKRLRKEAELASQLTNPHVAAIYDIFEDGDEIFIVMEYVEGETLRRRLTRPLSLEEFLPIAEQCLDALVAAHRARILHGDLKPENVMLMPGGAVKVLDFGVAHRMLDPAENATLETLAAGPVGGTLTYMAPEVLNMKEPDARADVFSLGIVFYEALAGRHPFQAPGFLRTCDRILHDEPAALRNTSPSIPAGIEVIVGKMLAKDPGERYATAAAVAADLRGFQRNPASSIPSLTPGKTARFAWMSSRTVAAGAGLLVLLGAAAWWATRTQRRDSSPLADQPVRSITILPFRRIAAPPEYAYFGVGLAEVLDAKLTNARLLEVHSPGSRQSLSDAAPDPLEVGRRLRVDAILSGSYQIAGEQLSLSYTLLDVRRNVEIAGNAYSGPLTQAVEVEHRLAGEIVESLRVSGSREELARFTAPPTERSEALQAFLRSKYEMDRFWQQPSPEQLSRAEQPLQEALRIDPHFTLALASLAKLHWLSVFWGYQKDPGVLDRAGQEADTAIAQDPWLGEAYAARALVQFQRGQLDRVRESLVDAFSRAPHSALAYYAAGYYYLGRGLAEESARAFRRAKELDPESVRTELAAAYRYQVELPQAEKQAREYLIEHPGDLVAEASLAVILISRGTLAEAEKIEMDLAKHAPNDPTAQMVKALVRVAGKKPFSIAAWLRAHQDAYWSDGGYCANVAGVLAMARQNSQAMRWLRRAGELSMRNYIFISRNPLYGNLHSDSDFQTYLASVRSEWEEVKRREAQAPLLPPDTP
ncbi:MAG TPA: protein kinase [Methylomirabilota bacterium]|nr:protein kinase [Methylomirabilota bacterium]